jgi:hypothetical protein
MVGNTSFARVAIPAFALAVAALAPLSAAQIKRVEPYLVVTTERGNLRCGDGELFYKIGDVAPGLTLMVDGESATHLQVAYPPTLSVGVRAEDTELQDGVLKLVKPGKLKALNLASGWSGSWKSASPTEVPAGTTLRMLEPIKDADGGPIVGYRVAPPEQSRAFIESRLARKATEAEVAAWKAKSVAASSPVAVTPTPAASTPTPAAAPAPAPGTGPVVVASPSDGADTAAKTAPVEVPPVAPAPTQPAVPTEATTISPPVTPPAVKTEPTPEPKAETTPPTKPVDLTQPVVVPPPAPVAPPAVTTPETKPEVIPGVTPAVTPEVKPEVKPEVRPEVKVIEPVAPPAPETTQTPPATEVNQVTPTEATTPVARPEETTPVETPVTPTPRLSPYDLEETFNRVWREPIMSSEMDELVGQYTGVMESLDAKESDRLLKQLKGRRDALQLRIELRDKMREQADARAAIEAGRGRVAEQLRLAEDGRVYTIIGQLQPSTVYDGQKLPLMYRIVSVGGVSPRTLGYLKDDAEMNLLGKIGAVVGVIGDAQVDRSLMLNIITPVRVDVLKPKGEAEAAAAANAGG